MNKLAVITGASKGIGLATAKLFAQHDYRVVSISRSSPPSDEIVHLAIDLADSGWRHRYVGALEKTIAGANEITLIHNAGLLYKDSTVDVSDEALRTVLEVNVVAAAQLNQLVLPSMKVGSSILYVGSTLSEKAVAGAFSYSVSKHATVGLMRATCQDLAGTGIHTACICPGFTDTEMLRAHVGDNEKILSAIAAGISFGRLIKPEEIAQTLYFCARNPVINGAVIHANLGQIET
jgi:3-oxoacyl-[acyl-carrier protein] reductase